MQEITCSRNFLKVLHIRQIEPKIVTAIMINYVAIWCKKFIKDESKKKFGKHSKVQFEDRISFVQMHDAKIKEPGNFGIYSCNQNKPSGS